jgi:hypothetical protein
MADRQNHAVKVALLVSGYGRIKHYAANRCGAREFILDVGELFGCGATSLVRD